MRRFIVIKRLKTQYKAAIVLNAPTAFKGRLLIIIVLLSWGLLVNYPGVFAGEAMAGQKSAEVSKKTAAAPAAVQFPALIDVGAKQCIPCKMMEPVLEELKTEYAGVLRVEFIDVQVDPQRAVKLGVRGIPTQIFYDASGKERHRHMGYISKEGILTTFKKLKIGLTKKDTGKKAK